MPSLLLSPARLMIAFLEHKERALTAIRDEGGLFENRFFRRLVTRERFEVKACADEAAGAGDSVTAIRDQIRRDLAKSDDTPGIIDPLEAAHLERRLSRLDKNMVAHTKHLQDLA